MRIGKIYKSLSQSDSDDKGMQKKKRRQTDSKVGRQLSELATKAVIIMCFMLLILLPMFNGDFWISEDSGTEGVTVGIKSILDYKWSVTPNYKTLVYSEVDANKTSDTSFQTTLASFTKSYIENFANVSNGPLVKIKLPGASVNYYETTNFSQYRLEEVNVGMLEVSGLGKIEVHQDGAKQSTADSYISIVRTFFICFILLGGSNLFSVSTYNLIINPIERMTDKVIDVIEKPQKVKEKAFIEQEEEEVNINLNQQEEEDDAAVKASMETVIVEDAIKKIGILLGVGLGEAGSSLINSYLTIRKDEKGESDVLMKSVQEMDAIFGFCDIRNFTDATEVLQSGVMVFVNTIADIVHTIADRNLGAANKNIGDAFLIVWKIPHSLMHPDHNYRDKDDRSPLSQEVIEHNKLVFTDLADLSMFAILKMYAETNRSHTLVKYVQNEGLRKRIGNKYKPKLGYGLHYGWAIEGAMGSHHKVDVSYLSPHVNVSSYLESNTKDYGVGLLISGEFYDLLSPEIKKYCRKVDVIERIGEDEPLRIYTPNISDKSFEYPKQEPLKQHVLKTKECYTFKKLLESEILDVLRRKKAGEQPPPKNVGPSLYENDIDIRLLICNNRPDFLEVYSKGFEAFEEGEWAQSKVLLEQALVLAPDDNPSKKILNFMKTTNFEVPTPWKKCRPNAGGGGH